MDSEVERKIKEMNEFHQALQENEENYSNILKKNRDTLESMKQEIEQRERELKGITVILENKTREKETFEERNANLAREIKGLTEKLQNLESNKRDRDTEAALLNSKLEKILNEERLKVIYKFIWNEIRFICLIIIS